MLRTSEPDYSASQNNSLSPPNGAGLQGGAVEHSSNQHSFNRGSLPLAPSHGENHHRQEGSERKNNPLANLLASANASVDTTSQANIRLSRQNNNLMVKEPAGLASNQRLQNGFREEPTIVEDLL